MLPPVTTSYFADIARTELLVAHGGIWVDTTVFAVQPLQSWPLRVAELAADAGMIFFHTLPGHPSLHINWLVPRIHASNWFIAASNERPLIHRFAEKAREYWNGGTIKNCSAMVADQASCWNRDASCHVCKPAPFKDPSRPGSRPPSHYYWWAIVWRDLVYGSPRQRPDPLAAEAWRSHLSNRSLAAPVGEPGPFLLTGNYSAELSAPLTAATVWQLESSMVFKLSYKFAVFRRLRRHCAPTSTVARGCCPADLIMYQHTVLDWLACTHVEPPRAANMNKNEGPKWTGPPCPLCAWSTHGSRDGKDTANCCHLGGGWQGQCAQRRSGRRNFTFMDGYMACQNADRRQWQRSYLRYGGPRAACVHCRQGLGAAAPSAVPAPGRSSKSN